MWVFYVNGIYCNDWFFILILLIEGVGGDNNQGYYFVGVSVVFFDLFVMFRIIDFLKFCVFYVIGFGFGVVVFFYQLNLIYGIFGQGYLG